MSVGAANYQHQRRTASRAWSLSLGRPANPPSRTGWIFTILIGVLLPSAVFLLAYTYLTCGWAFNSDDLLCSAFCDDLLHGRDLTGWHLPGAPYLFPDVFLLLPCQLLTPHVVGAFLAYCSLTHLWMLAVIVSLGRLSGLGWRPALTAAGAGVMLLAISHCDPAYIGQATLLVKPGSHLGAILVGLFLLALTIRAFREGWSRFSATVFVTAGALGAFSDKLVVVQVMVPLAVALVVLAGRHILTGRRTAGVVALLGVSVVLALGIRHAFVLLGFHLLDIEDTFPNPRPADLWILLCNLYQGMRHQFLLCALFPLHLLAAAVVVRIWWRRLDDEDGVDRRAVLLVALTVALAPLCLLAALFAAGLGAEPVADRYRLSCNFFPFLFLPLLLYWLPGRSGRVARLFFQAGAVGFALYRIALLAPHIERTKFEPPYPPLTAALDRLARERGPLRGLADFWSARSVNFFSREDVVVNALGRVAEPFFHASNPGRHLPAGDDSSVPGCQFIVVRSDALSPPSSLVMLHYGLPAEKIRVGPDEIWLYGDRRTSALDRFLRARFAERLRLHRRYIGPAEPACLAHPRANLTSPRAWGHVRLEPDRLFEIRFASPITGRLLDIGANFSNEFDLIFYRGEEELGQLHVPAVPLTGACYAEPGIQARLLPLPAPLSDRAWDRVIVHPREGTGLLRLTHFLVYAEGVAGLDAPPPERPRSVRLEGESLLPCKERDDPANAPDASASGGLARRVPAGALGVVVTSYPITLPPGHYRIDYVVKVEDNSSPEELVRLRVFTPRTVLAERPLRGGDCAAGAYQTHSLTFDLNGETDFVEFRLLSAGRTAIALDCIDLAATLDRGTGIPARAGAAGQECPAHKSRGTGIPARATATPPPAERGLRTARRFSP